MYQALTADAASPRILLLLQKGVSLFLPTYCSVVVMGSPRVWNTSWS
jgi:hypothetical protein